ncbi:SAGA complex subunit Sgf73 [Friedmanniomyces endolithicus]|uniref:SAGA complex subunit Sgf73 n=1 Tax=Friedmanniomyces endolithicus TaxID=329885 RepID=A0AAN6HAK8_9PEZI|nr:SAGA complex subunit Sgf73 [Friedmanniomyces endolithicus]KAK0919139.1 SAGA complex subunit Sgf73 [Friedmanniomyces endolithicus]KAK0961358.1 SAGA complex subunit Sgf73 [Friedmanniomyces endolithicus]KAK1004519.1 SAGA complex subunit Sgf73 [Friedmanniomyces endolithicus]KAK1045957.1 SAGA complex subunit Sgf73 [Friedmanniomyces endolithicus]
MAPNGTSRKSETGVHSSPHMPHLTLPAPAASAPKPSKADDTAAILLDSLFDDLATFTKPSLKENVRQSLPVIEKPGNWDSKVTAGSTARQQDKENQHGTSTSSSMNKIPAALAQAFPTGRLMADKPDVLKCNHCKRPVLSHAMPAHIEKCLNKKQEKQRKKKEAKDARDAAARKERGGGAGAGDSDADGEAVGEDGSASAGKKTAAAGANAMTASKKRKAVDEATGDADGPKKKKKKKELEKAKPARPKAPVDVERQCGVELPLGGQCARSLTCKSHSMGAKRGVPGRSAPYDKLLADYQRRNQARMQKAAFDANAPELDDEDLLLGGGRGVPVDEAAECEEVMEGIRGGWGVGGAIWGVQRVPLRGRYVGNRIRGILASAMGDRTGASASGGGFFGGGGSGTGFFGGATQQLPLAPNGDAGSALAHARKPSVMPGARSMTIGGGAGASRKASVAA